jgi:hypothetical protein
MPETPRQVDFATGKHTLRTELTSSRGVRLTIETSSL